MLAPEDFEVGQLSSTEAILRGGHSRFQITAFGREEDVHTVRFDLLGENARREDPAALDRIAGEVMAHLFPTWPEAASWPRAALTEAGSLLRAAAERAREEASTKPPDLRRRYEPLHGVDITAFAQEEMHDGKWVGAFHWLMGYSYLITTYPDCLPSRGRQY